MTNVSHAATVDPATEYFSRLDRNGDWGSLIDSANRLTELVEAKAGTDAQPHVPGRTTFETRSPFRHFDPAEALDAILGHHGMRGNLTSPRFMIDVLQSRPSINQARLTAVLDMFAKPSVREMNRDVGLRLGLPEKETVAEGLLRHGPEIKAYVTANRSLFSSAEWKKVNGALAEYETALKPVLEWAEYGRIMFSTERRPLLLVESAGTATDELARELSRKGYQITHCSPQIPTEALEAQVGAFAKANPRGMIVSGDCFFDAANGVERIFLADVCRSAQEARTDCHVVAFAPIDYAKAVALAEDSRIALADSRFGVHRLLEQLERLAAGFAAGR